MFPADAEILHSHGRVRLNVPPNLDTVTGLFKPADRGDLKINSDVGLISCAAPGAGGLN